MNSKFRNFSFVIPDLLAGMGNVILNKPLINELKEMNIYGIVSLNTYGQDEDLLKRCGMKYLCMRVRDYHAPTEKQIEEFCKFTDELISEDVGVVVHCTAGNGRTGTMLVSYLVYKGKGSTDDCLKMVREIRPESVDNKKQEDMIRIMEEKWKRD